MISLSFENFSDYSNSLVIYLDKFIEYFNLELKQGKNMYVGTCPCHIGDNNSAFNLYLFGDIVRGFWKCRTHSCEKIFGGNFFGFIRGVYSNQQYGWVEKGNKEASKRETIELIRKICGVGPSNEILPEEEIQKRQFVRSIKQVVKLQKIESNISREEVRAKLIIPAQYYLRRNYSKKVLNDFDVGLDLNGKSEMYSRAAFPLYNSSIKCVGFTGRSSFEKCFKCEAYHNPKNLCPEEKIRWIYSKWRNSKDLKKEQHLFNLWNAYPLIKKTGTVIITESPGNILRLVEAGFENCVALLGVEMSDYQEALLNHVGVMNVILANDFDKAGQDSNEQLVERLSSSYCLRIFTPPTNDLGEMRPAQLKEQLGPLVAKCQI